jgi:cytochrome c oxidase assembly factor CtaG
MAVLLWVLAIEVLYVRALLVLRGRGVRVPRGQIVLWHLGIGLWVLALGGPPGRFADESLAAHMTEHLLLADLGAPLLVAGMRNPVLAFLLPRSVLVGVARRRRLRGAFRAMRRPLVAIGIFVVILYGWHIGPMFEAAVRNPWVHALQHASFIGSGMLVWWAALEPKRRQMTGALWKIGHILGARMLSMMVGMAFVLIREPVYTGVYGSGERRFGLSAVADQQTAGGIMMSVDIMLMLFALAFFFFRAAQQDERDTAAAARQARQGPTRR